MVLFPGFWIVFADPHLLHCYVPKVNHAESTGHCRHSLDGMNPMRVVEMAEYNERGVVLSEQSNKTCNFR